MYCMSILIHFLYPRLKPGHVCRHVENVYFDGTPEAVQLISTKESLNVTLVVITVMSGGSEIKVIK